jgi:hypothetical protein
MCCVSVVAHCISISVSERIYITNIMLLWNIRGAANLMWIRRGVYDQIHGPNHQTRHTKYLQTSSYSQKTYVDKKYKAWWVVGRGWNVKWECWLGLLPSLIFHIVSPSDMGSFKATVASLMLLMYIENSSSLFWMQANVSHFNLSNIIMGMKKRTNPPEIYQSCNVHKMWPTDEYIIAVCSRGRSTE